VIAVPGVLDALCQVLRTSSALTGVAVLDGPEAKTASNEGIVVGASREDVAVEFDLPAGGMASTGERDTITCLVWSGSGATAFKAHRDRVDQLLTGVETALAADRTLRGLVAAAWISSGTLAQEQTGQGALVTAEIRVEVTLF
jgi:hypothetical protein